MSHAEQEDKNKLLFEAIERPGDNVHLVEEALRNGADIDARNKFKDTPLLLAVFLFRVEIVKYLLEHGANPKAKNQFGQTPLLVALQKYALVSLTTGIHINSAIHNRERHERNKREIEECIKILLEVRNTNLYETDNNGNDAFSYSQWISPTIKKMLIWRAREPSLAINELAIEELDKDSEGPNAHIHRHLADPYHIRDFTQYLAGGKNKKRKSRKRKSKNKKSRKNKGKK